MGVIMTLFVSYGIYIVLFSFEQIAVKSVIKTLSFLSTFSSFPCVEDIRQSDKNERKVKIHTVYLTVIIDYLIKTYNRLRS